MAFREGHRECFSELDGLSHLTALPSWVNQQWRKRGTLIDFMADAYLTIRKEGITAQFSMTCQKIIDRVDTQ